MLGSGPVPAPDECPAEAGNPATWAGRGLKVLDALASLPVGLCPVTG
jgi:hypothetical protein